VTTDESSTPEARPPVARSPFERLRVRGLVLQLLIAVAAVLLLASRAWPQLRRTGYATTNMLLAYGVMFLVLILRGKFAGLEWKKLFGPRPKVAQFPLLGVVMPLALITAATLILLFVPLSYLAPELVQHTILEGSALDEVHSAGQFVVLFLTIAVVAPIVEELFFRGLVLHRFARKWGTSAGVIASSALFAVGHVEWIGHFVTGVAFALIYLRTRSLWMSILAHGVYNGMFAVSIGWNFFTHQPEEVQTLAEFREGLGFGVLAFIAGVVLYWFYLDLYWKEQTVQAVMEGSVPYGIGEPSIGTEDPSQG
jgi:membrane protease YdiL (CAAX protease family)